MTRDWSPQQELALTAGRRFILSGDQLLAVFGYAGTGKTTLALELTQSDSRRWLYAAFTGKAAFVLRQKGCRDASTIHSLIYRPAGETNKSELAVVEQRLRTLAHYLETRGELTKDETDTRLRLMLKRKELLDGKRHRYALWEGSPLADLDVAGVVIDECSMVDEQMGRHLLSFGKKVIVLGDPAQLPPVAASGYFTEREPDVMLTEVHRQARESGVLRLATRVREGGKIRVIDATTDVDVVRRQDLDREQMGERMLSHDQTLVGLNITRVAGNVRYREMLARSSWTPERGDKLVCLRNDRESGLFNGSMWSVTDARCSVDEMVGALTITSDDDGVSSARLDVSSWLHHFAGRGEEVKQMDERREYQEFDYGYAMTVHKSQGSQWGSVLLIDQSARMRGGDAHRWLYTGVTRAAKRITVVID